MRWTEAQLAEHRARIGAAHRGAPVQIAGQPGWRVRARPPAAPATMNKTEAAYDAHLKSLQHTGEVLWHKFEAVKLRLADNTFYTLRLRRAARLRRARNARGQRLLAGRRAVKIKVAAALYPFRFIVVKARAKKNGGGWEREEFSPNWFLKWCTWVMNDLEWNGARRNGQHGTRSLGSTFDDLIARAEGGRSEDDFEPADDLRVVSPQGG
jgi:hypothetical protein